MTIKLWISLLINSLWANKHWISSFCNRPNTLCTLISRATSTCHSSPRTKTVWTDWWWLATSKIKIITRNWIIILGLWATVPKRSFRCYSKILSHFKKMYKSNHRSVKHNCLRVKSISKVEKCCWALRSTKKLSKCFPKVWLQISTTTTLCFTEELRISIKASLLKLSKTLMSCLKFVLTTAKRCLLSFQ
jgi:hypothetical protein